MGFNPRSRMGSDSANTDSQSIQIVSIHAPAWGATELKTHYFRPRPVSIHAPAWGATLFDVSKSTVALWFQSTLPHGERLSIDPASRNINIVSIHAPAWGATKNKNTYSRRKARFNPRSRMGSDSKKRLKTQFMQSFNPRSRMGSD